HAAVAPRSRGAGNFRVPGGWSGLYPLTPDTRPIVGPTPGIEGLYQALGGGGGGGQISPALAAIVARPLRRGGGISRVLDPLSRGRAAASTGAGERPILAPNTRPVPREEDACSTFWVWHSSGWCS